MLIINIKMIMIFRQVSERTLEGSQGQRRTYNNLTLVFSLRSFPQIFGARVGSVGAGITFSLMRVTLKLCKTKHIQGCLNAIMFI